MTANVTASTTLDAVAALAEDIARSSPECADKAMQIVDLARSVDHGPDRETVQDAIESKLVDGEMSDSQLQSTTSAVVTAIRSGR